MKKSAIWIVTVLVLLVLGSLFLYLAFNGFTEKVVASSPPDISGGPSLAGFNQPQDSFSIDANSTNSANLGSVPIDSEIILPEIISAVCQKCGEGFFNICDKNECSSLLKVCKFKSFIGKYGSCNSGKE